MAAVIHAHHRQGGFPVPVPVIEQRGHNRHGMARLLRTVRQVLFHHLQITAVHLAQGISLFRDRKADHLQGRRGKGPQQAFIVRPFTWLGYHRLRYGRHDFLVNRRVRVQGHAQGQVVISAVNHADIVHVKGVRRDDTPVGQAFIQQPLLQHCDKRAEDIARAEMNPDGGFIRLFPHLRHVEGRQADAGFLPAGTVLQGFQAYSHGNCLLCQPSGVPFSMASHKPFR